MRASKIFFLLVCVLCPLLVFCQSGSIIKSDSLNLCVLKLDYKTYNFEGGNLSYYKKCPAADSLPFIREYQAPCDFGNIKYKINSTLETVFNASIIWMGTGSITYPTTFSNYIPFN